jgi:NAD(P)-dependent dehydrogenase (short-subunit alcohol dehydrogenase family)
MSAPNADSTTGQQPITLPRMPSFRLDGKHALVTGGGRGLGLASAVALAGAGAHVTLMARSASELEQACEALRHQGASCDFIAMDVTDAPAVRREVAARGPFHVLVNSAGTNLPRLLVDASDDDIDTLLELNVKASMVVAREVARGLVAAELGGSIINISSQMGHVCSPRRTLYCATKHAIEGFTKALAWELGPHGIRVNTLCQTFTETALTAPMFQDTAFAQWVTERIALQRIGRPEEVMGAVVFLASEASSLTTGSALMVDGGWTAA